MKQKHTFLVVFILTTISAVAGPKENCSVALEALGYKLGAYTFEEAGWLSKEKQIFNGNLICYVDKDGEIHSIKANGVVLAEDGFFGQEALAARDRLNSERKKAIKKAIEEVEKTINEEFDAKLLEVKQNSIPNAASFVGGTLLAPPQEQPPAELATNTSKTMEHASAPPVPSSSDRDATHEIETGELSLESGPQPESEPQQKPEHEPESQPEPDPQQEPEPQSEFPASTTNASNEPDDPFIAHEYKIVDTSDTSAAKRKRTRLRIHAPTARTPSALIATAMEAAVEVQNTHQSQFVSVFVHAEDDPRSEMLAQVNFAPDGCGVSGDACTGDMWFSATSVAELPAPRQSAIFEAAKKNEDSFKKVVIHEIDGDAYDVLMGEVKPLYDELMLMKDEERFRTVGFSAAGPYNRWLLDVQRLTGETDELQLLRNWNITVGELLQMGMDYLDSKGSETTQTKHARERFSLAVTAHPVLAAASRIHRSQSVQLGQKTLGGCVESSLTT